MKSLETFENNKISSESLINKQDENLPMKNRIEKLNHEYGRRTQNINFSA